MRGTHNRNHERLQLSAVIKRHGLKAMARGQYPDPHYCRAVRAYCVAEALYWRAGGDKAEAAANLAAAKSWRDRERASRGP
jgi:hypothetical protein